MSLSVGIVGLPNVGKSTLFNALTSQKIAAENYPFCTIDPNVGIVPVPDNRLDELGEIENSSKVVPAVIEFYDIAGLVRGAHKGEGLGNAFLSHIREVDAILHVLRHFESDDIQHVEDRVDPKDDKEIIETELIMKDLDTVTRKREELEREVKRDQKLKPILEHITKLESVLNDGDLAHTLPISKDVKDVYTYRKQLFLITDKPILYIVNGDWISDEEYDIASIRDELAIPDTYSILPLNIQQEYELSILDSTERDELMAEMGITYTGLQSLIRASYDMLGLQSFFTAGEKESRAWTMKVGDPAPKAGSAIHADFESKFITAEVVSASDFIELGGWVEARKAGKARLEGRDYIVKEGDVILFRLGA